MINKLESLLKNNSPVYQDMNEKERPNNGIIYGGLVAHTSKLYKAIAEREAEPKPKRDTSAKEHYTAEIENFMRLPDDFLKDKQGREVFAVAEISEYLGLSSHHTSRHCPKQYFAAKGKSNLLFRGLLKIGGANVRGIAVKNQYMWHNATPIEVNAHIKRFIDTK